MCAKRMPLSPAKLLADRPDQLLRHQRLEMRVTALGASSGSSSATATRPELLTDDRGSLHHHPLLGAEPVEPRCEERADRGRNRDDGQLLTGSTGGPCAGGRPSSASIRRISSRNSGLPSAGGAIRARPPPQPLRCRAGSRSGDRCRRRRAARAPACSRGRPLRPRSDAARAAQAAPCRSAGSGRHRP